MTGGVFEVVEVDPIHLWIPTRRVGDRVPMDSPLLVIDDAGGFHFNFAGKLKARRKVDWVNSVGTRHCLSGPTVSGVVGEIDDSHFG